MFSINLTHREPSVITRADRARDAGNWEIAVRLYRIALSRNPSKPSIWIQYGHALKESGNIADAETAYGTALAYDPEDGDAHLQLGHVLKLQGKLVEAKAAYSRAFMFDNSATEARRELREFGLTDQEISEYRLSAKVGLQWGTASTPTRASIITRADRALAMGRFKQAARLYRVALDRNPKRANIWVQYGHVLKELGRTSAAENAYRIAISCDRQHSDAYLQLAYVLRLQGKAHEAEVAFFRALITDPMLSQAAQALRECGWSENEVHELRCRAIANARVDSISVGELDSGIGNRRLNPIFSVVIPVHARTWEFREALESVLAQSFSDFEVIIVTNAAPLETMQIVYEYMCRDGRIRCFFYKDDSGNACRGRNRGIIEAQGKFVSFLDSDDLYFPDTLEKVYQIFLNEDIDVVCGRAYFVLDGTRPVGDFVTGTTSEASSINIDGFIRGENPIQTCTVHVRRELLLKHGGFRPDQEYLEDLELWLRLAHHGCRFHYSNDLFAKYRFHQGNTELKYINQRDYWLEVMRNNYLRPYRDWGIGPVGKSCFYHKQGNEVPIWSGRVDGAWYLRQYPDVARAGADPLEHFRNHGRYEGRMPNRAEASAQGWCSVMDVKIACLRPPVLQPEVAILITHSRNGQLKPHVSHYVSCLRSRGISTILVVATDETLTNLRDATLNVDGLFLRENKGFDFAAWAHVLRLHPELADAKLLYLLNDSVIGPINDARFDDLLHRLRTVEADFVGLTESFERGWHIQSYFLALKKVTLSSVAFRDFVESIVCYRELDKVVTEYELKFATLMKIAGMKCVVMFQKTGVSNPTIYHWKNLIESGFPFLKVKTVRDHYPDVDVSDWREVLRSWGYDVSLAERAIAGATDETNHTMAYPKAPDHLGFREISGEQWSGTLPLTSIVRQGCTSSALSVLICTHELSESGAPRAAFDVARVLRDAGHYVVVASRTDGPYRERLCNIGVEVKVDDMLFAHDRGAIELGYRFDRIVCNTILCWPIVARLREVGQVYWYIHESELIHQLVKDIPALMPVLRSDVLFLVPSALSAGALAVYGVNARVIGYGVDDLAKSLPRGSVKRERTVIGVFGSYEPRKGQDLAVAGMLRVPEALRSRAELRLFGRTLDAQFRCSVEQIANDDRSIIFFDEVDHNECVRQMTDCDIVLAPSRDDPLPFVTLDALSLAKVLVCSRTTGTSAYLRSAESALILRQNSPEEIGETLSLAISDPGLRTKLGQRAREVYEREFTWKAFRAKLLSELEPGSRSRVSQLLVSAQASIGA